MAELTLVEAVNDALHTELARDDDVMVIGEDVGRSGGVFRATAGLRDRFGPDRCVDTPLAEAGILGSAVGLCMAGWRPVCEMQYDAFSNRSATSASGADSASAIAARIVSSASFLIDASSSSSSAP